MLKSVGVEYLESLLAFHPRPGLRAPVRLDFIEKCWVAPPKRGGNVLQQRKMDAPGTVGVVESLYVRL